VPTRWYFNIVRDVMIKGLPFSAVWQETLILASMTVVLLAFAVRNFKERLA
jgi:ABC-2 type transport system permease protein